MSILSMFQTAMGQAAPVAAQQVPPNNMGTPGNIPPNPAPNSGTVNNAATAPNGSVPASIVPAAAASPLDDFAKLWETDPNAVNKANEPYFNADMAALQKAAANQDFAGSVMTPELIQAAAAGGEAGIKAMMTAMNSMAQAVYARSAFATTKIVESGLNKAETRFTSQVPDIIKRHGLNDGLRTENPAFSHPAAQPMISALQQQLVLKYPTASEAELRNMATSYLTSFANVIAPSGQQGTQGQGTQGKTGKVPQEQDWSLFLDSNF